ncbi:hypothetical protein [Azospirillum brasilense]|uniref:hypothetical protein n=1 Tax=Azospirillum brasilense TaxID=192 RepID=UPI000E6814CC|nr:hypothetical protein [Azospirillum brasilense]NUB24697.1 hypothetical protein [Azospirillum brasilense]NUB30406.1 hypothetical protein [Azospirillum brasilense]RIW08307.1 hypothetical protein D2T81_00930 [Azospirillum brasilense]
MAQFAVYGSKKRTLIDIVEAESFRDASMIVLKAYLDVCGDETVEEWIARTGNAERDVYESYLAEEIVAGSTPAKRKSKQDVVTLITAITDRLDIDELKATWLKDPTFNLEDEPGFEDFHDELREFRLSHQSVEKKPAAGFDIETIRTDGISYANVSLTFDDSEWVLKRRHSDWKEPLVWAGRRDEFWMVFRPSSANPFDPVDVLGDDLTEEQAVLQLVEIGGQMTRKAA